LERLDGTLALLLEQTLYLEMWQQKPMLYLK